MEWNEDMKQNIIEILKEALKLPPEARAALAGSLLDSLDESIDKDAESEWVAEIALRLKEIDQGKVNLIPWAEARAIIAGQVMSSGEVDVHPEAVAEARAATQWYRERSPSAADAFLAELDRAVESRKMTEVKGEMETDHVNRKKYEQLCHQP